MKNANIAMLKTARMIARWRKGGIMNIVLDLAEIVGFFIVLSIILFLWIGLATIMHALAISSLEKRADELEEDIENMKSKRK